MTQIDLDFSYQTASNFTNREEYLEFRHLWKEDYKMLSSEIRAKKAAFKESQRHFSKQPYTSSNYKPYWEAYNDLSKVRRELQQMSTKASEMISERKSAKEKSHEQYLAEKTAA